MMDMPGGSDSSKRWNSRRRAMLLFVSMCFATVAGFSQLPFQQGVNLTQWFQTTSVRQVQFSKFTRTDLEQIKELGCDVIRLPISLHAMTSGAPDFVIDPLFFVFMDQVTDWTEELGLHLILDNHTFDPNDATDPNIGVVLNKVWGQMAAHFKNRSARIYYEILNEPHGITAAMWGQIQQGAIEAIRAVDREHYIIVGGVNYNSYNDLATLPSYTDQKLIYTFHFYDPFLFTHQGASWTDPSLEPLAGIPFPHGASAMPVLPASLRSTWLESAYNNYPQEGTVARVKQLIDIAAAFSASRGVPVYCGEFGVYLPNSNDQQRVAWYKLVRDYLQEKNIPWTTWDYRGTFGLFEKNTDELFDYDINVPLLEALSLNVPPQANPVHRLQTTAFDIYDDYIGAGIVDASNTTAGTLDYYHDDAHDGKYAIHLANVDQYFAVGLDFRPNLDMSLLPDNNYVLEFWVRGDTPASSFDVRFVDSKTGTPDHPWRLGLTIDQAVAPWDNAWHYVRIPLSMLQEKGSYDNGWFPPEGKFSWHEVDRLEIVAESQSLTGVSFQFDGIRVSGDPVVTTAVSEGVRNASVEVFPNPATATVHVKYDLKNDEVAGVTLTTVMGSTVRTWHPACRSEGPDETVFDVRGVQPGLYFLHISTSQATYTEKIRIE
ncbi:MAG TPA: cellulase family glycosylhydrolase [Chryseolinea sp.]|nr:cellulase family glycosylhydrolase [Chryseolinea sp.]